MAVDSEPADRWSQARGWMNWIARVVVAVAVTYVFIVVLLVATAQQKVDDALTKEAVGYDYNVAVRYYFGKESLKNVVAENSKAIKQATDQLRGANDRVQAAEQELAGHADDLKDDLARLAAAGCAQAALPPAETAPTPAELVAAAVATQHCAGEPNPTMTPLAANVLASQRATQKSLDDAAGVKRDAQDIQDRLDLLQAERNTIDKQLETA